MLLHIVELCKKLPDSEQAAQWGKLKAKYDEYWEKAGLGSS
jgi:hypothetical protein